MIEVKASISRERLYMKNFETELTEIIREGLEPDTGDYYNGMASFLAIMHLCALSGKEEEEHDHESGSVRALLI